MDSLRRGQTYPDKVDSENTLDAFLGKSKKGRKELVIEGMFNYAYRQGDWALIPPYYNPYSKEDGDFIGLGYGYKLYNLKSDIGQQKNLAEKYPKKLGELINRFEYLPCPDKSVPKEKQTRPIGPSDRQIHLTPEVSPLQANEA